MPISVLLADDHALVRDGLKAVLDRRRKDIVVTGEAANGNEVLALAQTAPPDIYVVDISMPELNGLETTDHLLSRDPAARVVILSMHDSRTFVERAFRCGARGYILKESAAEEVVNAISEVYAGRYYVSPRISQFLVQGFLGRGGTPEKPAPEGGALTRREREVLQMIAEGFTNKEIAKRLHIAMNTVHVHRNNLMRKLGLHRQADLVRYAIKEGLSHL